MTSTTVPQSKDWQRLRLPSLKLLVDGEWRDAVSGATFPTIDPATEQVIATVPEPDERDAVRIPNDSPYSLAAGLWTADVRRAHAVAHRLRAGMVWVNTYGQTDTRLPWGGLGGDSGVGRDLGETALENYTDRRAIWVNLREPR